MSSTQPSTILSEPACTVLVFPLARRTEKVRRVAELLERKHGREAEVYWSNTVRGLFDQLDRAGIDRDDIRREVDAFQVAVQAELRRRCFVWGPTGGAA
ncbi:MAG: hypothetical protein EOS03_13460 [Mesorhizobium sp.]|uniref:DUF6074 family protein n=1 Tax=Mesorhizobium sp. TaxID=1871066 RepID=UPI000FE5C701|nr:DUF6074 family protein [Mesorhizobium sp.]RWN47351.1 MAG: hypothetical protein EOS03_13460 [Mesorhizobium sp.]